MRAFAIRFAAIALVLFGVVYLPTVRSEVIAPFTVGITHLSGWVIQLWGGGASVNGNILSIPGFSVQILDLCNGVEATLVLWSALLAFPAPWHYRLYGLVLGTLSVHAVNILRIVSLLYLGIWRPEWFDWVHWYLWDALIMLDILLVFVIWIRWLPIRMADAEPRAAV